MRKAVLSLTVLTPSKRTMLTLFAASLVGMALLFGLGLKTAETQTTTPKMQLQDLGTLGGSRSLAYGINDSGKVVGSSDTTSDGGSHAFLYDEGATPKMQDMNDLGTLSGGDLVQANSINDSGKVVGYSFTSDGEQHGFLYDESATPKMQDLNDLIPADSGWTINEATAINSDGKIAANGDTSQPSGFPTAFLLTPSTTATPATYEVQNLGTLGGDYSFMGSVSKGINDSGQVLGYSYNWDGFSQDFLYDESVTPKMQDLGSLSASGLNGFGKVVGSYLHPSSTHDDGWRAILYDSVTKNWQDLGTLGGHSHANSINDSDQVVGYSYVWGVGNHAFLKENGQPMIDLNTLIPPNSGWGIYEARLINSGGKIVASGGRPYGVGGHALLLTPTSDSSPPADTQAPSAPTITSPANNSYNKDGVVTVSGTAEAGSSVTVVDDASSPTTKTATADTTTGAWSVTFGSSSSKLSDATYTYSATAKDAAGNTSSASTLKVTVDKTSPTIKDSSLSPASGAINVTRNTPVMATFSEAMDPTTVTKQGSITLVKASDGTSIPATVTYDTTVNKVTLKPSSQLAASTKYKVTVKGGANGVTDKAGNPLASDKIWSFTTGKK